MVSEIILDILKNKKNNQFSVSLPKKKMLVVIDNSGKRPVRKVLDPKKIRLTAWEFLD